MALGRIIDVFFAIVGVATAFVIVSSKNTAPIITAWGNTFSSSLRAAMGN